MADNQEFGSWLNGVTKRARKKKTAESGKGVSKGERVDTAPLATRRSTGAAKAAERKKRYDDMRWMYSEQQYIKNDPEERAAQKRGNRIAENDMKREIRLTRGNPDRGALTDLARQIVPVDDRYGKMANTQRIRNAYRKKNGR